MFSRKNLFLYIALFYTLYIIFPLFADVISIPVWLPSILTSSIMLVLYPSAFKNKVMYWFVAYAVVLALFTLIGKPLTIGIGSVADNKKIFIEFAYILPVISIFSVFYYLKDYSLTKRYVIWSLLLLYVSFIVAVPLMVRFNSLREALKERGDELTVPGLPEYGLMHAYTLCVTFICYFSKYAMGKWKLIGVLALFALSFVIYSTFVTTSLLVMLFIIFFTFIYDDNSSGIFWFTLFLVAVFAYMLYELGVFVILLDAIQPIFSGTAVENKILDFKASMLAGELQGGTIMSRQRLHSISWNSFLENPLLGTSKVGGHSSLLDRLGGMGLLGGLPFIMIFITYYKIFLPLLSHKRTRAFFLIGCLSSAIFIYEKGNWGASSWLIMFVMMPFSLLVMEKFTLNNKQR